MNLVYRLLAAVLLLLPGGAHAELTLSQLVVDLTPAARSGDIEIFNDSPEKAFLLIEPSEILEAGTAGERRVAAANPTTAGILVTPTRAVLEPGQRKRLRIASTVLPTTERTYRVLVKPVSGDVTGSATGLKLLVGYDVLALVRPASPHIDVKGTRRGNVLTIHNAGNVSVELVGGQQCALRASQCSALPAKRLYAGATWSQTLKDDSPVTYKMTSPEGLVTRSF